VVVGCLYPHEVAVKGTALCAASEEVTWRSLGEQFSIGPHMRLVHIVEMQADVCMSC
jgi:hypothetical protein